MRGTVSDENEIAKKIEIEKQNVSASASDRFFFKIALHVLSTMHLGGCEVNIGQSQNFFEIVGRAVHVPELITPVECRLYA